MSLDSHLCSLVYHQILIESKMTLGRCHRCRAFPLYALSCVSLNMIERKMTLGSSHSFMAFSLYVFPCVTPHLTECKMTCGRCHLQRTSPQCVISYEALISIHNYMTWSMSCTPTSF